jgi:hypothetical protein
VVFGKKFDKNIAPLWTKRILGMKSEKSGQRERGVICGYRQDKVLLAELIPAAHNSRKMMPGKSPDVEKLAVFPPASGCNRRIERLSRLINKGLKTAWRTKETSFIFT